MPELTFRVDSATAVVESVPKPARPAKGAKAAAIAAAADPAGL